MGCYAGWMAWERDVMTKAQLEEESCGRPGYNPRGMYKLFLYGAAKASAPPASWRKAAGSTLR